MSLERACQIIVSPLSKQLSQREKAKEWAIAEFEDRWPSRPIEDYCAARDIISHKP